MKKIYVSIVDDHTLFSSALAESLEKNDKISIAFTAVDGIEFFTKHELAKRKPDVVLMDLKMDKMDGMETTKKLKELHPNIKIIVITMHKEESYILKMISFGVDGYLFKNVDTEIVLEAIIEVNNGEKYFNSKVLSTIVNRYSTHEKSIKKRLSIENGISKRELEVLNLLCQAKTAKEIGSLLFISERTVEVHRSSLLGKTNSKNTIELVLYAIKNKIVKLEWDTSLL